jgi:hypothetical protein
MKGHHTSLYDSSGIILIICNVKGSPWLCNITALLYPTFRVWGASDLWVFLTNIFALLFDTFRVSDSTCAAKLFKTNSPD